MIRYAVLETPSPVGSLLAVADGEVLTGLHFVGSGSPVDPRAEWTHDPTFTVFRDVESQLRDYTAGRRRSFEIPMKLQGTEFQRAVWSAILTIPFGETISYRQLAELSGSSRAIRGAGAATGRNPIAIVVPCHRVMGSNGSLTGYGGGLERKRALLELEARVKAGLVLPSFAGRGLPE